MINYAWKWKTKVNLRDVSYEEFIEKYKSISSAFFLEKIDGVLGALVYEKGKVPYFVTINNIVIKDLPVLEEYNSALKKMKIGQVVLIGELVAIRSGDILPFNQISSIVRTSYKEENKPLIYHYLYDMLYLEDHEVAKYRTAIDFIRENFLKGFQRIRVPKIVYGNIKTFKDIFERVVGKPGIEGIVARTESGINFKVKPTRSIDVAVIGAGNIKMKAWQKKQISYLIVAFVDRDGNFRRTSKVGTGFSEKERRNLYEFIVDNKISEELDGEFFVKPRLVVEVEYDRYRISSGPVYRYVNREMKYERNDRTVMLDFPSFKRFRLDKGVNPYDIRFSQIAGISIR